MNKGGLGYSIGFIGQGVSYVLVSTYFVVFMTECVGVGAAMATTIMSVALVVEVFAGMMVGNLSDNWLSKNGRRRPFILFAAISMPIILVLLFHKIEANLYMTIIYYFLLSILFRVSFSAFEIPNNAFGSEIAKGYNERIKLRTNSRIGSIVGNCCAYVLPLLILDLFVGKDYIGWNLIGILAALISGTTWLLEYNFTKCYGITDETNSKQDRITIKNIFHNYIDLFKLKTMRILMIYKGGFACGLALFNVATIYYFKYCIQVENRYTSYAYMLTIVVFVITTPLIDKSALYLGKAKQQRYMALGTGIIALCSFVFGGTSFVGGIIFVVAFAAMQNSFWQLSSSIFYDIVEVDEFVYGKRRAGDISSMVSVLGTFISAIIVQMFGIIFQYTGFNPGETIQPEQALFFLKIAYILIPAICLIISGVALNFFPITKVTFESLVKATNAKRNGEEYLEYIDDINKII